MSRCGYACVGCGVCTGETKPPILVPLCIHCGHENPFGSTECERCGASLVLQTGVTNTAGAPLPTPNTTE